MLLPEAPGGPGLQVGTATWADFLLRKKATVAPCPDTGRPCTCHEIQLCTGFGCDCGHTSLPSVVVPASLRKRQPHGECHTQKWTFHSLSEASTRSLVAVEALIHR